MEEELNYLSEEIINEIVEFIDREFSSNYSKEDQIENSEKLYKFLKNKKISLNETDAEILLEKSNKLNLLFSCLIKLEGLSIVLKINNISKIANMYCLRENIEYEIESEKSNKDLNLFSVYMKDISQYKRLTPEEEFNLGVRICEGDLEARDLLVMHNLKFVVFIANEYSHDIVSLLDIIQFGNEGLMIAANKFNPYMGVRFSSFASYYIKQRISRGIMDTNRAIRLPINTQFQITKIRKLEQDYIAKNNGKYPSISYLSENTDLSIERISMLKENMKSILSLDTSLYYEEEGLRLMDTIEDTSPSLEEQANVEYLNNLICYLKSCLSSKQRDVIDLLFGFDGEELTLDVVGSMYGGVTRERVRQVKNRSLSKMKDLYQRKNGLERGNFYNYL